MACSKVFLDVDFNLLIFFVINSEQKNVDKSRGRLCSRFITIIKLQIINIFIVFFKVANKFCKKNIYFDISHIISNMTLSKNNEKNGFKLHFNTIVIEFNACQSKS